MPCPAEVLAQSGRPGFLLHPRVAGSRDFTEAAWNLAVLRLQAYSTIPSMRESFFAVIGVGPMPSPYFWTTEPHPQAPPETCSLQPHPPRVWGEACNSPQYQQRGRKTIALEGAAKNERNERWVAWEEPAQGLTLDLHIGCCPMSIPASSLSSCCSQSGASQRTPWWS